MDFNNQNEKEVLQLEHDVIPEIDYEFPPIDLLAEENEIKNIIQSEEYVSSKSKTIIGVKEEQNTKIIDIKETSHILVSGTTGMGKTTLLDNIIINILYKSNPDETKFIMVDQNNNSLRLYNGIPHLLIPVITDAKKSLGALAWIVQEIEDRNKKFLMKNVINIEEFNEKVEKENKFPTIIVMIDEISEIVNINKDEVDYYLEKITKQGQKAGIYLIISTNRPSSDIVAGAVKSNIYTRISFYLPEKIDSRLILDMDGAEQLKNKGDMLFKTIGTSTPEKYHCPYISANGIKKVVEFLNNGKIYDVSNEMSNSNIEENDDVDPLLLDAINVVVECGQASASFIQRRFKVGYERAGKIIDQMEERGIISGYYGSEPRKVLITPERLEELKLDNNSN